MDIKYHIASSSIISSIVYFVTNSPLNTAVSFLAGVFIDLDHFIDYYLNYGFNYKHRPREIYDILYNFRLSKVYLFLHSFELLFIFWILIFLIPLNSIYLSIAIGVTQHMFFDQICNPITSKAYFLSYRLNKGFKREFLLIDTLKISK